VNRFDEREVRKVAWLLRTDKVPAAQSPWFQGGRRENSQYPLPRTKQNQAGSALVHEVERLQQVNLELAGALEEITKLLEEA